MEKELLPIGTVVMLEGGTKKVMITGFCSVPNDNDEEIYDYSGCMYPEGVINSDEVLLFNNGDINEVFFKGYEDDDEKEFKSELYSIFFSNDNVEEDSNDDEEFTLNDSVIS